MVSAERDERPTGDRDCPLARAIAPERRRGRAARPLSAFRASASSPTRGALRPFSGSGRGGPRPPPLDAETCRLHRAMAARRGRAMPSARWRHSPCRAIVQRRLAHRSISPSLDAGAVRTARGLRPGQTAAACAGLPCLPARGKVSASGPPPPGGSSRVRVLVPVLDASSGLTPRAEAEAARAAVEQPNTLASLSADASQSPCRRRNECARMALDRSRSRRYGVTVPRRRRRAPSALRSSVVWWGDEPVRLLDAFHAPDFRRGTTGCHQTSA